MRLPVATKGIIGSNEQPMVSSARDSEAEVDKGKERGSDQVSDVEKESIVPSQAGQKTGEESESRYQPRTLKFWLIISCNLLSLFVVTLDRTIVSTAIPRITDDFDSLGDIGWYGSAFLLTGATSQLLYGRIYRAYDMKRVFLLSIVIFEIGSAICAGRAIAGFASAGVFSGCMLIIIPMIPLHKRPMFQGMFGGVFGVSSVMGPLVGGAFTSSVTWRWCFYINLPIGAVTIMLLFLIWDPPKSNYEPASIGTHLKRLDPLGMFFFVPAIVSLLLALQWGGSTYSWSNSRVIALFVLFGVLILLFAAVQILRPETATIPARVITQRSMFCAALYTLFISSSMILMVYFLPIWFQTVKLASPIKSGIYTLPLMLSMVLATFIAGFMTQKTGYYVPAMYICPCILSVGLGLMSTFNLNTDLSHWISYQFLSGFGLGFGMQVSGLVVQRVLPFADVPIGIALVFFLQQLGGSVFATIGQSILTNYLMSQLSDVPGLDSKEIFNNGATNLASVVPPEYMVQVRQAYNGACTKIFLATMGVSLAGLLASLGMEWKSIKKGKNGQDAPTQKPEVAAKDMAQRKHQGLDGSADASTPPSRLDNKEESLTVNLIFPLFVFIHVLLPGLKATKSPWKPTTPEGEIWQSLPPAISSSAAANLTPEEITNINLDPTTPNATKLTILEQALTQKLQSLENAAKPTPLYEKDHPTWQSLKSALFHINRGTGDVEKQESLLLEQVNHPGPKGKDLAALQNLAGLYAEKGEYEKAERLARETVPALREHPVLGRDSPQVLGSLRILIKALAGQGKIGEAEGVIGEAEESIENLAGGQFEEHQQEERDALEKVVAGLKK
ncbi:major facilitator superfamily domain-containing protein [Aspergillus transmontanensis]|uniref:Major facilitator superfamily domain-containing protein n=1 Tax=Aspergillus transmontanensis TaxID=1034304 RepID=A0A5N6VZ76_9EURO|nr:major facilitator superfamily domain-containing protein [Aspergillus transmontanensis]